MCVPLIEVDVMHFTISQIYQKCLRFDNVYDLLHSIIVCRKLHRSRTLVSLPSFNKGLYGKDYLNIRMCS